MSDTKTPVIDSQVHCYERNRPERPWANPSDWPAEVTGDDAVAFMDSVGVDGALFVSAFSLYRFDASYAVEVQARHPGRFAIIKPFDTRDPAIEEALADWAAQPGVVGARIMMVAPGAAQAEGVDRMCAAAARHGLPVNVLCWGNVAEFAEVAGRHSDTRLVIDHMGIQQPTEPPAAAEPFADLDNVLKLARHDNVAIKVSGACTLSHEPFPFPDIWDPLARIFDAFGMERCMWGTDWTRAANVVDPAESVKAFFVTDRLSDSDRAALMGGSLSKIYNWAPTLD